MIVKQKHTWAVKEGRMIRLWHSVSPPSLDTRIPSYRQRWSHRSAGAGVVCGASFARAIGQKLEFGKVYEIEVHLKGEWSQ